MRMPAAAGLAVWLLALAGAGAADAKPKADPNERKARALYRQATEAADSGRLEEAAEKMGAAYSLFPAPPFLFNLGVLHERMGDRPKALDFYRRYLREPGVSNPELAAKVRSWEPPPPAATPPAPEPPPDRPAGPAVALPARVDAPPAPAPVRAEPPTVARPAPSARTTWKWVTLGVAGAGLVTGTTLAIVSHLGDREASDLADRPNPTPSDRDRLATLKSRVRAQSVAADVTLAVGAAAGVASLVLFLTEPKAGARPGRPSARLLPLAGPEAGVAVTGTF